MQVFVTCVAGTLGGLLTWPGRGGDQSEAAGEAGQSREQQQPPVTGKQEMAGSQQPAIVRPGDTDQETGDSQVTAAIILDTIHPHPHTHGQQQQVTSQMWDIIWNNDECFKHALHELFGF